MCYSVFRVAPLFSKGLILKQDKHIKMKKNACVFLSKLPAEAICIQPCSGTLVLASSSDVFKSSVDPTFTSWGLEKKTDSTRATTVAIYELIRDGNFAQMFSSLNTDFDNLVLSQHQIRQFCEYSQEKFFSQQGAIFFLFRSNCEFFVARLSKSPKGLGINLNRLGDTHVWLSEFSHRVVIPIFS